MKNAIIVLAFIAIIVIVIIKPPEGRTSTISKLCESESSWQLTFFECEPNTLGVSYMSSNSFGSDLPNGFYDANGNLTKTCGGFAGYSSECQPYGRLKCERAFVCESDCNIQDSVDRDYCFRMRENIINCVKGAGACY